MKGILQLLVPQIIRRISEITNMTNEEAINNFYNSKLYNLLEDDETKLWHFSYALLADLFVEEITTGKIEFPVEG